MNVGGGKLKGLNHPDRVDLHIKPKTVKGLITKLFTIIGCTLKDFRTSGPGKSAYMNQEAIKYDIANPIAL